MLPVLGKPEEGWTQQTLIDTETESEPTVSVSACLQNSPLIRNS